VAANSKKKPLQLITSENKISTRRRYGAEVPVYMHPSDDYVLDHILHAAVAKFTGGISPASLVLAGFDWWEHLLFSPSKQHMLGQSFLEKTAQITYYAMQIASGNTVTPIITSPPADRRFVSDSWQRWPFNVMEQSFLLSQAWWLEATTGVRGVSPHHQNVTSFIARQLLDVVSPSNFPFMNPDILATTPAPGGMNFWHGLLNWLDDTERSRTNKPPVGSEAFVVGENIACTEGKVVFRNHLIELIQYAPTTTEVFAEPILITPAWIMKYYILDLSPYNSLVKYLVDHGYTVFMISWRNPDACDRNVGLEEYLHAGIGEAMKAVKIITHAPQIHGMGYCLGGTLLSMMAASLARDGDETLKTLSFLASQVDFVEAGELRLFVDDSQLAFLEDVMWQQGYLDKHQMAGSFQMLRTNDLIWSRMITDYMQGNRQPMNDLMAWNADATRMPYRMHSEYLRELFLQNNLAEGRFMVNSAPIALQDIRMPIFSVGTVRDHVAPWKSVYKILLLTESDVTFVLTSGGHNAGIVSEPKYKGRSYQISTMKSTARYIPPGGWQTNTPTKEGSWWEEWQSWLDKHSDEKIKPPNMGSKDYPPIQDAPGNYVIMK
jgi:polyhydroxyalkanoate synthase subunit PhaC